RDWLRDGAIVKQLFRYREARLLTHRVETIGRPLRLGLLMRVLSRGEGYVEDERGSRRVLTLRLLGRWGLRAAREPFQKSRVLASIARDVAALEEQVRATASRSGSSHGRLDLTARPVYLRTDISVALKAGGSVGHIAGVLNHLADLTGRPILLTTDPV